MKKFVLAALVVLLMGHAARAALVLHVPDIVLTESSVEQTGSFDIYLEETLGTDASIDSYNVGIQQIPGGVATFTGFGASSAAHPMLLNPTFLDDLTANVAAYQQGRDIFLVNDAASPVAVENGVRDGLASISYSIPANTPAGTVIALNIDPANTLLFNGEDIVAFVPNSGSITITPIPEPAAMGLALLALPLLARRRR